MKALIIILSYFLLLVLLATVSWGEGSPDWSKFKNGDFVCTSSTGYVPCDMLKKGHCPHCGAKYTLEGLDIYWPEGSSRYSAKVGKMYFCPNGHMFWERD